MNDWDKAFMELTKRNQEEQAERDEELGIWTGYAVFMVAVIGAVVWVVL